MSEWDGIFYRLSVDNGGMFMEGSEAVICRNMGYLHLCEDNCARTRA